MSASTVFFLLLVLACLLMMRGGHGRSGETARRGGRHAGQNHATGAEPESTDELRRRRDALDRLIEEREREDAELGATGSGRR